MIWQVKKQLGRGGRAIIPIFGSMLPWPSCSDACTCAELICVHTSCRTQIQDCQFASPQVPQFHTPTRLSLLGFAQAMNYISTWKGNASMEKISLSRLFRYTKEFCRTWMSCCQSGRGLCHFACLPCQKFWLRIMNHHPKPRSKLNRS